MKCKTGYSKADVRAPQSAHRRSFLMNAGLAVPIGSAALLAACGGGGSGTTAPPGIAGVSPAVPGTTPATPGAIPGVAPTAPTVPEDTPPASPPAAVKNVRILNLQLPTGAYRRLPFPRVDELIKPFARRVMYAKFELLRDALVKGLPEKRADADLCYLVAPELFWNVGWNNLYGDDDIENYCGVCMVEVQVRLRMLISLFPQAQYGKIAVLAGTMQMLQRDHAEAAARAGDAAVETRLTFEALNYALMIDNFSKPNADGSRPIAMWPQRHPTIEDFDQASADIVTRYGRDYFEVQAAQLRILVAARTTMWPSPAASDAPAPPLANNPAGGVSFGIDIGEDYVYSYGGREYESDVYERVSELAEPNYLLNFLVSCTTSVDGGHKYAPNVQYVIWNDGSNGAFCRIYKLSTPDDTNGISHRVARGRVWQNQLLFALPFNAVLHDAYLEMQPAGQFPSMYNAPWESEFFDNEPPLG